MLIILLNILISILLSFSLMSMELPVKNQPSCLNRAVKNSKRLNLIVGGNTILHRAAKNGCTDLVIELINEYAHDPDVRNWQGCTPLMMAAQNGHLDIVKFFLEVAKASLYLRDNDGASAQHYASRQFLVMHYLGERWHLPAPVLKIDPKTGLLKKVLLKRQKEVIDLLEKSPPKHVNRYSSGDALQ